MTGTQIIERFRGLVDDQLSDTEDLALLNDAYRMVLNSRPWSFLYKAHSGTMAVSTLTLPTDFAYIPMDPKRLKPTIYMGTDLTEYDLIPFTEARYYRDEKWKFYIDLATNMLTATEPMDSSQTLQFDYIYIPVDLTAGTSPIFWSDFHASLAYAMVLLFNMSDQEEKDRGYSVEAEMIKSKWYQDMAMRDARVKLAI